MKYEFTYRNTAADLWQLSMYYTYGSMVGVCNMIFTAAVFALGVSRWNSSDAGFKTMIILGCCLFTVFQPFMVWRKAKKQAASLTQDTYLVLDDNGIHVRLGEETQTTGWKQIKRVSKKPTMIVIFTDTTHGYVLTKRILGEQKAELYAYISEKIGGQPQKER